MCGRGGGRPALPSPTPTPDPLPSRHPPPQVWDDAGDDYLFDPDEERIEYEERSAARELRRGGGGWEDGPGGRGGWEEPSPGARPQ